MAKATGAVVGLVALAAVGGALLWARSSSAAKAEPSPEPRPVAPVIPDGGGGGPGLQPDPNMPKDVAGAVTYLINAGQAAWAANTPALTSALDQNARIATQRAAVAYQQTAARFAAFYAPSLPAECQGLFLAAAPIVNEATYQATQSATLLADQTLPRVVNEKLTASLTALAKLKDSILAGCKGAAPAVTPPGPRSMSPECAGILQWINDMTPYVDGLAAQCEQDPASADCAAWSMFAAQVKDKQAAFVANCGSAGQ